MSISSELHAAVLAKLGWDEPLAPDLPTLRALFRAWSFSVPFDNSRKVLSLARDPDGPLPLLEGDDFLDHWLEHGTGGTCWLHGNGIFAFFKACGFDARRASGSIYDSGTENHSTTIVRLEDGSHWILDNAFLSGEPLRIDANHPSVIGDSIHFSEVEVAGDGLFVHGVAPPMPGIFFRLIEHEVTKPRYDELYEVSRTFGPFNDRLHVRHNSPDSILVLRGKNLFTTDRSGTSQEVIGADRSAELLMGPFGLSANFVGELRDTGVLDRSVNAPEHPAPDLPQRTPPSRR